MNQFNPTIRTIQQHAEPDLLAGSVLNSLTRPVYHKLSWGVLLTFIFACLTLGILPVLMMARWLRGIIAQHEQQFWHLAEWIRIQSGDSDAVELQKSAQMMGVNVRSGMLTWVFLVIAAAAAISVYAGPNAQLRDVYSFAFHWPGTNLQFVFTAAISLAALSNLAQLARHRQFVDIYLRWFNQITARQGLPPVRASYRGPGMVWVIAGAIMASTGALWAAPVMVAAGVHRRYTIGSSGRVRAALAERLQEMLRQRRPSMRVPQAVMPVHICIRPNCRSPLPTMALFCPRCGTRVARAMDVVA